MILLLNNIIKMLLNNYKQIRRLFLINNNNKIKKM